LFCVSSFFCTGNGVLNDEEVDKIHSTIHLLKEIVDEHINDLAKTSDNDSPILVLSDINKELEKLSHQKISEHVMNI